LVSKELAAALFVVGVSVGIALHRLLMAMVLDSSPDTLCAYCEWLGRKKKERGLFL